MPVLKKIQERDLHAQIVGVLGTRISTLKFSISDLACIRPYSQCQPGHKFEANHAAHADPSCALSIWHN